MEKQCDYNVTDYYQFVSADMARLVGKALDTSAIAPKKDC